MLRLPIWGWLIVLLAMFCGLNLTSRKISTHFDLTSNKRYTLAPASKTILENLNKPVRIRFYLSESDNILPLVLRNFSSRVEDFLQVISESSNEMITIEKFDPLPDSEAEVAANLDGIQGEQMGPDLYAYFGLTVNGVEQSRAIPFLDPRDEINLEYNLLRAIQQVSVDALPKIGIYSTVSTFKGTNDQGGASALVHLLRSDAEVVQLSGEETSFPADMELIVVIHPQNISEAFTQAVTTHMSKGNGLCLLLDPLAISEFFYGQPPNVEKIASDWPEMLEMLGIKFDSQQAVLDMKLKAAIDRGEGEETLNYLLHFDREGLNEKHPVTRNVGDLRLVATGSISHVNTDNFLSTPVVRSSFDSTLFPAKNLMSVSSYDAKQLLQKFRADEHAYDIAMILDGRVSPSANPCRVFVMADLDFMTDPFAGTTRKVQSRQVFDPANGSMGFFLNCIDYIRGGHNLSTIRNRKHHSRPFSRLINLQRQAEKRYHSRIVELEERLSRVQTRNFAGNSAHHLEASGQVLNRQNLTLLNEERKLEKKLNQELHLIRRQLRNDVSQIETRIKWLNIGGIPLLVLIIGGGIVAVRHRQSAPKDI